MENSILEDTLPENDCYRCHKRPHAPGKARCVECLEYARQWQKKSTRKRRDSDACITCGADVPLIERVLKQDGYLPQVIEVPASRCEGCRNNKSLSYFGTRAATDIIVV